MEIINYSETEKAPTLDGRELTGSKSIVVDLTGATHELPRYDSNEALAKSIKIKDSKTVPQQVGDALEEWSNVMKGTRPWTG